MKSLTTSQANTALNTPQSERAYGQDPFSLSTPDFQRANSKMIAYMTNSIMDTIGQLAKTGSVRKSNKQRISVIPLTREKVRVGQRGWKRRESRGTTDCTFQARMSPFSKEAIDNSRSKQYVQFFNMLSFMYNKTKRGSYKLQVLLDQLSIYFSKHRQKDYIKELQQIVTFAPLVRSGLFDQHGKLQYQEIKNCQGQLAKLCFNVCFEIYLYKTNQLNYIQLAFIHRDIQYYARRLGMLTLTLVTCMDIGRVSLDFFDFQKAQEHYSRALKLSVFNGDKYREELCIDRLGMCEYYRGDLMAANFYHSSVDRLSSYNKLRIMQHYSNDREIQKILQQKTKQKSHEDQVKQQFFRTNKENIEFNFDLTTMDSSYTQNNYDGFRRSMKEMIKVNSLRKKVPAIKATLDKVRRIGEKKYRGNDYFVPKASKFYQRSGNKSQDEFMQTHRSYNRNNVGYESIKIDKHCKIIDQVMNFIETDLKNIGKSMARTITEERESLMEQEV